MNRNELKLIIRGIIDEIDIINEGFETVHDFLLNPEHNELQWGELLKKFESNGGMIIGQGRYATVLEHPSWKYVLKIFSDDIPYLSFVRFCLKNSRPSFPVFYDKPRRIIPNYTRPVSQSYLYIVKMEKLYGINKQTFEDIAYYVYNDINYIEDMIKQYGSKYGQLAAIKKRLNKIEKKYPQLPQFMEDFKFMRENIKEEGQMLDIHQQNIMKRSDGSFVISDPYQTVENMYQRYDRLVKAEIGDYDDEELVKGGEIFKKPKVTKPISYKKSDEDIPF